MWRINRIQVRKKCLYHQRNIVTRAFADQETINKLLREIFGIETGYHGSVVSSFAKVSVQQSRNADYKKLRDNCVFIAQSELCHWRRQWETFGALGWVTEKIWHQSVATVAIPRWRATLQPRSICGRHQNWKRDWFHVQCAEADKGKTCGNHWWIQGIERVACRRLIYLSVR